jgi:hypothetical protein
MKLLDVVREGVREGVKAAISELLPDIEALLAKAAREQTAPKKFEDREREAARRRAYWALVRPACPQCSSCLGSGISRDRENEWRTCSVCGGFQYEPIPSLDRATSE